MAGINLSQSAQGRDFERGEMFDQGALWSLVIFLLVLATWGGLSFYTGTLEKKIADLDASLVENNERLRGPEASRVADFDTRLALLDKNMGLGVEPAELFSQLEKLTVPSVTLTKYEYSRGEKRLSIIGSTDNFKYLAQQITSLKSEDPFTDIRVESVGRTKEGRIVFTLQADLTEAALPQQSPAGVIQ